MIQRIKDNLTVTLIAIVIIALTVFAIWNMDKADETKAEKYSKMSSREVALICTTDMATEFHIHPELSIYIDNVEQKIPSDVGVTAGCMNALHTHDDTGVLHVESPVQKDFTLGDFFAVWKQSFDRTHILDKTAEKDGQITLTVDGVDVDTFENTILTDGAKLEIRYKSK